MAGSEPVRWGVVCTADEPLALLCGFALHHLELGACEVHIYLDKPRPGHRELLETIDGVRVVACNKAYWQGRRNRSIENRQAHNAFDACAKSTAAWLCHIDCDEFIAAPGDRSVAAILADQPDEIDYLVMRVRERIYRAGQTIDTLFAGAALSTNRRRHGVQVPTPALRQRDEFAEWGLLGHAVGKSFVRTGRPLVVGIHRPRPQKDHPRRHLGRDALNRSRVQTPLVTHFDGLTPFHWVAKHWRMARFMKDSRLAQQPPYRAALIRQVRSTLPDIGPLRAIESNIRHLDPASLAVLQKAGVLHSLQVAPDDAVVRYGALPRAAFSLASFDAELAAMRPQLAALRDSWLELEAADLPEPLGGDVALSA